MVGDTQVIGKMKFFAILGREYLVLGYTYNHMWVRFLGTSTRLVRWKIECDGTDPDITFPEEWL